MKTNKRLQNGIWAISLIAVTAFLTPLFQRLLSKKGEDYKGLAKDSTTVIAPVNMGNEVKGDINTAGRDVNTEKIEIKPGGTGFFDSSRQVNNYNNTIEQRQLDLELMKKICDSIPNNKTPIQIACGGGMEGENLGRMMSKYLINKGYSQPIISSWAMTGNYEIIEYSYDSSNNIFFISIHPRANANQIQ